MNKLRLEYEMKIRGITYAELGEVTDCVVVLGQKESSVVACKHCGKYFYREDVWSAYCSHRCRNQYHVY